MTDQKKQAPLFSSLVDDAEEKDKRRIIRAQVAIIIVAVVTIIFSIITWISIENKVSEIEANPLYVLNEEAVNTARLLAGGTFLVGVIFFGLYFWANKKPFEASLTALILYLVDQVSTLVINFEAFKSGAIIKLLIIIALAKGVEAGWTEKKISESNS
jgi:hypothetical protein